MDISVVIPVLNAAAIIPTQLQALSEQDFGGTWEIIVADNGSTDSLVDAVQDWTGRLPPIRIVDASYCPGEAHARNVGIMHAESDRIAFCDADDIVSPKWVSALHAGLNDSAMATGPEGTIEFDDIALWDTATLFQRVHFSAGPPTYRGVPYAAGGNSAFRRAALSQGYATDYSMGDGATSFRARLEGHTLAWCPDARYLHRRRPQMTPPFARAVASGVARMRLDREFGGQLWPDTRPHLPRRSVRLAIEAPRCLTARGRAAWVYEFGVTIGAAIENITPGLWAGWRLAHVRDLSRGMVASVESRGSSQDAPLAENLSTADE